MMRRVHNFSRVHNVNRVRISRIRSSPDIIVVANELANSAHVTAMGISAFVSIYCTLQWNMYRAMREDKKDSEDP